MERKFEKVENSTAFWKPETVGDTVEGEVVKIGNDDEFGLQVSIKIDDVETMLPSHKVLQNRLCKFKVGDYIKVQFTGEELPKVKGQNPMKLYDVWVDKK